MDPFLFCFYFHSVVELVEWSLETSKCSTLPARMYSTAFLCVTKVKSKPLTCSILSWTLRFDLVAGPSALIAISILVFLNLLYLKKKICQKYNDQKLVFYFHLDKRKPYTFKHFIDKR